jgi:D-alanyl-D-alanine-carboxypeptidase/D-alanyl-D-alanine-endopeptidase
MRQASLDMKNIHYFCQAKLVLSLGLMIILTNGCAWDVQKSYPREWSGVTGANPPEWTDGHAPDLEPMVRKHCTAFLADCKSVGLAVAVVSGTNTTVMGFGHSPAASEQPPQGDTLYEIGSITKTFTALALAREIERGNLRLDQPVSELLPDGLQLPKEARGITLRHLTTHTSGFPSLPDNFSLWRIVRAIRTAGNPYANYTEEQFREAIRTVELNSKPGTKLEYSNFGMDLLGFLLSHRAGMTYETYIKREVCEQLGMHDTTITLTTNQAARFAQGYMAAVRDGKCSK